MEKFKAVNDVIRAEIKRLQKVNRQLIKFDKYIGHELSGTSLTIHTKNVIEIKRLKELLKINLNLGGR